MYDGIILAGGYGKRLYPVTDGLPKPLVNVGTEPVIFHAVRKLAAAGVKNCAVTLMYEGEQIKERLGKEFSGVKLGYFTETEPLGTAGGVKRAAEKTEGDSVIVVSGDAVFDFDIKELVRFHDERKADVTIALYEANDPTEFGTVTVDSDGRVKSFSEKAPWSRTVTGNVNTGIYIIKKSVFDLVPDGKPYDFANDLFPKLLYEDKKLYATKANGYWCDIGSLPSLFACNMAVLRDKTGISAKNTAPSGDGTVCGRTLFGENCILKSGSTVRDSVLGNSCTVGVNSEIKNTVAFDGVEIGDNCILDGVMLSNGASVPDGTVATGCIFARGKRQRDISSSAYGYYFSDDGIKNREKADGEKLYAFGAALAKALSFGKVGISHDGSEEASDYAHCIALAAADAGCSVTWEFGRSFSAQAAFAAYSFGLGASVFVSAHNGSPVIKLYDSSTYPVCADFERALLSALRSEKFQKGSGKTPVRTAALSPRYTDALIKSVYATDMNVYSLDGIRVTVSSSPAAFALRSALSLLDAEVYTEKSKNPDENGMQVDISDDGFDISITANGKTYTRSRICSILASDAAYRGEFDISASYERLPEFEWADDRLRIEKFASTPATRREALARFGARRSLWISDAAFTFMRLAAVMKSRDADIEKLASLCRTVTRREMVIPCKNGKTVIMDTLIKEGGTDGGEGVVIKNGTNARANIICNRAESLRIISYATSAEAADELIYKVKKRIENMEK